MNEIQQLSMLRLENAKTGSELIHLLDVYIFAMPAGGYFLYRPSCLLRLVPAKWLIVREKILMNDCLYNRESARRGSAPIWGYLGGLWEGFRDLTKSCGHVTICVVRCI